MIIALLLAAIVLILNNPAHGTEHSELKAFPKAKKDMERFVIVLPHKERGEEDDFMVEIIVGKTMLTDGVNQMRLGNIIKSRPLKGWGYTYYEVTGEPAALSTLIGVPEGTAKVKKFVFSSPLKIRYNSRLPIVVYVPKGLKVQYRIWKASETVKKAEKG